MAAIGAAIDLPFRIATGMAPVTGSAFDGLRAITERATVWVVATNSQRVASAVKVYAAVGDASAGRYGVSRPGHPVQSIQWSAPSRPPSTGRERATVPGYASVGGVPAVEPIATLPELVFDDGIVVFPHDTGIAPVYVSFKPALQYPGVATGEGLPAAIDWSAASGAPVPASVADRLRGKVFKRFDLFAAALWQAVAGEATLASAFTPADLTSMQAGHAPSSLRITHRIAALQGGALYDMDNLQLR